MSDNQPKPTVEAEIVDDIETNDDDFGDLDVEMLLPSINKVQEMIPEKPECIVKDEEIVGLYKEILENCRKDRQHADEILTNFLDMVMNDGDASSASKEAIVNILKIKTDSADKMAKIADLMTRVKLKDTDTFPKYLAAQQNNKVVIESSKRDTLKSVNKLLNKSKKGGDDKKN